MPQISDTGIALRAYDSNGDPVSGALLRGYLAGTSTPVTIYSDEALTIVHSGVSNAAGVFPPAYLAAGHYKFDIQDPETLASLDGFPIDDVALASSSRYGTVAELNASTEGARGVGKTWEVAGGYSYTEAESGASDHHATTAGGVKLYISKLNQIRLSSFNPPEDGTDATAETQEALDAWRKERAAGNPCELLWDAKVTCNSQLLVNFDSDDQTNGVIDMAGGQLRSGVSSGSLLRFYASGGKVQNLRFLNFDVQNAGSTADVGIEFDGGATGAGAIYRATLANANVRGFRSCVRLRNELFEFTIQDPNFQCNSENRGDSAGLIIQDSNDAVLPYGTNGGTVTGNASSILVQGGTIAGGDNNIFLADSVDARIHGVSLLDARRQSIRTGSAGMQSGFVTSSHLENSWRAPDWEQSTAYLEGAIIYANSDVYKCVTAGTSAASGTGPSGTGSGISDGTASWDHQAIRPAVTANVQINLGLTDYRHSAGYATTFIRSFIDSNMTVPFNLLKTSGMDFLSVDNGTDNGRKVTLGTEARGKVSFDTSAAEPIIRILQNEHHYAPGSVSGTYTHDMDNGRAVFVTATGNITIANPTNAERGDVLFIAIKQDATGGRTITWGSEFRVEGLAAQHPSATTRAIFWYTGVTWQCLSLAPEKIADGTVSNLPTASLVENGTRTFVTDASSPTFLAAVSGGGSAYAPVFSDGTSWIVG